jgi:hypothetical protein
MKQEIEISEWIENFLNGDLTADERAIFRKKLEEDPDFVHEVELHRQLRNIISDGAYLNIKSELKSIHLGKIRITKRIKRITGFGVGGLIIGVILLWVQPGWQNREKNNNEQLVSVQEDSMDVQIQETPLTQKNQETASIINSRAPSADQNPVVDKIPDITFQADTVLAKEEIRTGVPVENKEPKTEKQVSEPVSENKPIPAKPEAIVYSDCRKVKIEGSFLESESCNDKPTGSIVIDRQTVTGGQAPYTFSMSRANFRDTLLFSGLYPGSYAVYARDANNCIRRIGLALIRSVDCTNIYQAVFAPLRGEIWTIPVDPDRSGTLNIFSKAGILVYSVRFTGSEPVTWSGTTISGQALPMGIYQFGIRYADGGSFMGNVTIVR